MSDQYVILRRKAIALFGVAAASAAAETVPPALSAGHARNAEPEDPAATTPAQYIFGYGSLIQRESRMKTLASAEFAFPVVVKGVARGWFHQTGGMSWNPTYLGAVLDKDGRCNGVDFPVREQHRLPSNQRGIRYGAADLDPPA